MYLVTGGAGFIGSHLVDELISRGEKVRIIDNFSTGKKGNIDLNRNSDHLETIEGDIRDYSLVNESMRGVDGVYHLAAMVSVENSISNPADSFSNNAQGSFNIFEAARVNNVKRVVFASSAAVYGQDYDDNIVEDVPCKPISQYALDKLYTEKLASLYFIRYRLESVALRYFNVFGSRQDKDSPYSGVISKFTANISANEIPTIHGDGKQTRDFIYVEDIISANLKAMSVSINTNECVNIGTGVETSIHALLNDICQIAGCKFEYHAVENRAGDIKRSVACIDKASSLLSWTPEYDLKRGLLEMISEQGA